MMPSRKRHGRCGAVATIVLFLFLTLIGAGSACLMNRPARDTGPPPATATDATSAPAGDTDTASKGIVDRTYEPHAEFLDIMQELNEQAYALADHFLNRAK